MSGVDGQIEGSLKRKTGLAPGHKCHFPTVLMCHDFAEHTSVPGSCGLKNVLEGDCQEPLG